MISFGVERTASHRISRRRFVGSSGAALAYAVSHSARRAAAAPSLVTPISLTGRVIRPQDAGYDEARLDFNARFSRFPKAIVMCSSVEDVQNAVRWARENDVPLRARSGRHSYEAYSVVDDGLVIDVSGLDDIRVDTATGQAVVGAGVHLSELYHRLWDFGVTVPGGTCPGVGIAGLTLGGGIGFLSRQYGLTCDNVVAVDLVDAEGQTLRASDDEHADLFWALRGGGGGNFGIATAFTFRVLPIGDVALSTVIWPWQDLAEALDAWQRWAPSTDPRLASGFVVSSPSEGSVSSAAQFNGSADELRALLDPLLGAGSPGAPQIRTVPYLTAVESFAGADVAHSTFKNTGAFVTAPLSQEAIGTFVAQMEASPGGDAVVGFFAGGGAVADIAPTATAFVHRNALFDIQYQAYWHDAADAERDVAWVGAIRDAMLPYTNGSYVNYIDTDLPDWATAYYGENLPRLQRVKAQYDPDNVFNGPQSIPL